MSDSADHHLVSFFTIHYINYWMVRVIARKTDQFSSLVFFLMNSPIDHRNKPPKRWSAGLRIWLYYGAILTTAYLEHHFSSFNMSIVNLCKPLMCVKQLWTPYSIRFYTCINIYIHTCSKIPIFMAPNRGSTLTNGKHDPTRWVPHSLVHYFFVGKIELQSDVLDKWLCIYIYVGHS